LALAPRSPRCRPPWPPAVADLAGAGEAERLVGVLIAGRRRGLAYAAGEALDGALGRLAHEVGFGVDDARVALQVCRLLLLFVVVLVAVLDVVVVGVGIVRIVAEVVLVLLVDAVLVAVYAPV